MKEGSSGIVAAAAGDAGAAIYEPGSYARGGAQKHGSIPDAAGRHVCRRGRAAGDEPPSEGGRHVSAHHGRVVHAQQPLPEVGAALRVQRTSVHEAQPAGGGP